MDTANKAKHSTAHPTQTTEHEKESTDNIYQVIQDHPLTWIATLVIVLGFIAYVITKFKITWRGYKPIFTNKSELKHESAIQDLQKENSELTEKLKSYRPFDFYKKTENGEYIGYSVAKRPYVEFWADGNWSSQEYHIELDTFGKLWGDETEIIIYGKNPNIPSDFYAIVESKVKTLPQLTIYCEYQVSKSLTKYFSAFENVKIVVRS